MKLNICYNDNGYIPNYTNIQIKDDSIDLNQIVNNSCEEIIAVDTLDHISYNNVQKTLLDIVQKLRLNGKLIIVGTDIRSLSRLVSHENISIEQFNEVILSIKSMNTELNIKNILVSVGLSIESSLINHHKYEIVAMRKGT